jgi:hypothetical protein
MRVAIAEGEEVIRNSIRGTLPGCCADATAPATTSAKAITESPSHFRCWIADFGLSGDFEGNAFIGLFSCVSIEKLKSKI